MTPSADGNGRAREVTHEEGLRHEVLRAVLRYFVVAAAVVAGIALLVGVVRDAVLAAVVGVLTWLLGKALSYGRSRGVAVAVCVVIVAAATYATATGNGIADVSMLMYPVVLVLAAVILPRAYVGVIGSLALVTVAVVGVVQIRDGQSGQPAPPTLSDLLILVVFLVTLTALARLVAERVATVQREASATETNYRAIFDATHEGILVHDPDTGRILDVNRGACELFGLDRQILLSEPRPSLAAERDGYTADEARHRIRLAVSEGPQVFDWLARDAGGREFWVEVTLRAIQLGGASRVLAVVRDIDERRRLQERVLQSEKLQAVGMLAGGVAHDFNNQLTGILGFADVLAARLKSAPEMREPVEAIRTSALRAAALTQELLAFGRRGKYRTEAVDLHVLIREVTTLLGPSTDKRIVIEKRLDATRSLCLGDPSQLANALLNLGLNARDAMPDGGRVVFSTEDDPGHEGGAPRIRIRIRDEGQGMDAQTRARLFEPFFTTKQHGTGIGLAAVYGTVTNHGGTIEVDSSPGRGTTFTLSLPLDTTGARPRQTPTSHPRLPSPSDLEHGSRGSVLIVDDEPAVARVASAVLGDAGYIVHVVGDGAGALDVVRARSAGAGPTFDAALVDLVMPGLQGDALVAALHQEAPDLQIIVVSGYAAEERVQKALALGGRAFLAKPYRADDLENLVASAVSAARKRRAAAPQT